MGIVWRLQHPKTGLGFLESLSILIAVSCYLSDPDVIMVRNAEYEWKKLCVKANLEPRMQGCMKEQVREVRERTGEKVPGGESGVNRENYTKNNRLGLTAPPGILGRKFLVGTGVAVFQPEEHALATHWCFLPLFQ